MLPPPAMQVLIVDDDDFALSMLDSTLSRMGYTSISARDGNEALEILRRGEIHLVITDWDMPGMNGVDLCRAIRREDLSGYIYIVMLTGREGRKQQMEGLYAGADDFLNKPLNPEELLVCLKTAERILSLETRDVALFALAKLAESRDPETGAHVERVQTYTRLIAQNLSTELRNCYGVDEEYIRLLYQTSALHDLGKVGIPDTVLLKPGKLTSDEFDVMKTHTIVGAQTLDAALQRFPNARFLVFAREIAASHHERYDGTGYPLGLTGEQIPLSGRIVAVADVYDALTSRRVYKDAIAHKEAKAIILEGRGTHFDPDVIDAFLRAEPRICAARERLADSNSSPSTIAIPAPLPTPMQVRKACKILVVDDEPLLLQRLADILAGTGHVILTATNGTEALELVNKEEPSVIISDWVMPSMDGVELCRALRSRVAATPIHFLMLTAHSDKSRLLDAYEAGINDFVSKPFDVEELLARVRAGIRAAKLHEELVCKASGTQLLNGQLAALNSRLERLSITDELTGLFNRRHAMSRLEEQWSLSQRYPRPLTIAMIDIDHFKSINDAHGHSAGDAILRRAAIILREQTRGTDAVCRVGGEEFLIIFPAQTTEEALICVERIRVAVGSHKFDVDGKLLTLTLSAGLASRAKLMDQYPDLIKAADEALYAAKHGGRNCVVVANQLPLSAEDKPASQSVAPAPPIVQPIGPETPINLETVLKRCGGDQEFLAAVTQKFRQTASGEVGKIDRAMAANDADAVRRTAHSLKSMAAYMSADKASTLAAKIETLAETRAMAEITPVLEDLRTQIQSAMDWLAEAGQTHEAGKQ